MKDRKKISKLAKTIFIKAVNAKQVKATGDSLKVMSELISKTPEVLTFLSDIFQPASRHQQVLDELTSKLGFSPIAVSYFRGLLVERHIDWVTMLSAYYQRLADRHLNQEEAVVLTPLPLKREDRESLIASLSRITGKKIIMKEQIDPSLIAGLKVMIGSTIFDGSLSHQLQRIEKEIRHAS